MLDEVVTKKMRELGNYFFDNRTKMARGWGRKEKDFKGGFDCWLGLKQDSVDLAVFARMRNFIKLSPPPPV